MGHRVLVEMAVLIKMGRTEAQEHSTDCRSRYTL